MKTTLTLKQIKALAIFNYTVKRTQILSEFLDNMQLEAINTNETNELRKIQRNYKSFYADFVIYNKVANKLYCTILIDINDTTINDQFNSIFNNSVRHYNFINK